jgi:hypothetical protein
LGDGLGFTNKNNDKQCLFYRYASLLLPGMVVVRVENLWFLGCFLQEIGVFDINSVANG